MDWRALLVVSALSSIRVICTYTRGHLLRRTVRTAIREIPRAMTAIDVRISDPRGPSADIRASTNPASGED